MLKKNITHSIRVVFLPSRKHGTLPSAPFLKKANQTPAKQNNDEYLPNKMSLTTPTTNFDPTTKNGLRVYVRRMTSEQ